MNLKHVIVPSLAALLFAGAPLAFADTGNHAAAGLGAEFGLGHLLHLDVDSHASASLQKSDDDADDAAKASFRAKIAEERSHVTAGVVTSINGGVFTIDPFGPASTTTVSTNSDTVFKAHGSGTTSAALSVGSKVFLFGTTTATSTSGDSFSASMVKIFERGLGHLRFWLWFH